MASPRLQRLTCLSLGNSFWIFFPLHFFHQDFVGDFYFVLFWFFHKLQNDVVLPLHDYPIKSSAILLGAEVTRSPGFRGEENWISKPHNLCGNEAHSLLVSVSDIWGDCVYNRPFDLCDGEGGFFVVVFKLSEEKKKKVVLISRLIYTSSCILCGNILKLTVSMLGTFSTVN